MKTTDTLRCGEVVLVTRGAGHVEAPWARDAPDFRPVELEECFQGDAWAITSIVQRFSSDFGEYLDRFEAAIAAGDGPRLTDAAHAARGACLLIGLTALAGFCQDLERAGEEGDFGAARGDLEAARACWAERSRALAMYVDQLRARA